MAGAEAFCPRTASKWLSKLGLHTCLLDVVLAVLAPQDTLLVSGD